MGGSSLVPIRDQDTLRAVQVEAGLTQALNSKFFSPNKVAEYFRLRFRGQNSGTTKTAESRRTSCG